MIKEKNELEQKAKYGNYSKTILDLKAEIDSIQSILREKMIEYQELEGENLSLNQMNEVKNNEINRLKIELKNAREKNIQLKEHKHLTNQNSQKILRERNENDQEMNNLMKEIENLSKKNYDDEKKLQELEFEIQRNETMNYQSQKSNKYVRLFLN